MLNRPKVLLISALIIVIATVALGLRGRSQDLSDRMKKESATPVQEGVLTVKEHEHGKIYSKEYEWRKGAKLASLRTGEDVDVVVLPPTVPSAPNSPVLTTEALIKELYCEADAVIVGTIASKASQLTEDGTFAFTTYQVSVAQVLRNNANAPIFPADNIEVTRPGGAIILNGRVVRVKDESFPSLDLNQKYLLFLRFIPSTGSYKAFRRGTDFEISADNFSPLKGASLTEDLQRGGQKEILLSRIDTVAATGCYK